MERRTLIRLLVGFGIGIPLLIELATFLGLVGERLRPGGTTRTGTPTEDRVGVGDDLLPATPHEERLLSAVIQSTSGAWPLTLTVQVSNRGNAPYAFELGPVTTDEGREVDGGAATGSIPPGDSQVVTGRWDLPAGSTPSTVRATGTTDPDSAPARVSRAVPLAKIPVSGG